MVLQLGPIIKTTSDNTGDLIGDETVEELPAAAVSDHTEPRDALQETTSVVNNTDDCNIEEPTNCDIGSAPGYNFPINYQHCTSAMETSAEFGEVQMVGKSYQPQPTSCNDTSVKVPTAEATNFDIIAEMAMDLDDSGSSNDETIPSNVLDSDVDVTDAALMTDTRETSTDPSTLTVNIDASKSEAVMSSSDIKAESKGNSSAEPSLSILDQIAHTLSSITTLVVGPKSLNKKAKAKPGAKVTSKETPDIAISVRKSKPDKTHGLPLSADECNMKENPQKEHKVDNVLEKPVLRRREHVSLWLTSMDGTQQKSTDNSADGNNKETAAQDDLSATPLEELQARLAKLTNFIQPSKSANIKKTSSEIKSKPTAKVSPLQATTNSTEPNQCYDAMDKEKITGVLPSTEDSEVASAAAAYSHVVKQSSGAACY